MLGSLAEAADRVLADPLDGLSEPVLQAPIPVSPSIRDLMALEEHVVTSMRAVVDGVVLHLRFITSHRPGSPDASTTHAHAHDFAPTRARPRERGPQLVRAGHR